MISMSIVDAAGETVIVMGESSIPINGKSPFPDGKTDVFVSKINLLDSSLYWTVLFGRNGTQRGYEMAVSDDGSGIYVSGTCLDDCVFDIALMGGYMSFVFALDGNTGLRLWYDTLDAAPWQWFTSVQIGKTTIGVSTIGWSDGIFWTYSSSGVRLQRTVVAFRGRINGLAYDPVTDCYYAIGVFWYDASNINLGVCTFGV